MVVLRNGLLILFLIFPLIAQAQYGETIRTGRPGASIGPFTVGKQIFQIQTGAHIARASHDFFTVNELHTPLVLRYGLWERIEINGLLAYTKLSQRDENTETDHDKGLSAAQIGVRFNILDGQGSGLSMGIQGRVKLNVLSEEFDHDRLGTNILLAMGHPLGENFGATVNLGLSTPGDDASDTEGGKPRGFYSINLGMSVSKKVSAFIETYGTVHQQDFDTMFDTGLGYLINPNFQLDFSVGYGNNDKVEDVFVDFGLSWRTGR